MKLSSPLLESYLARVGLDGSDLSIATMQRAHVCSIPFENIDPLLGRAVSLDVGSVTNKLVAAKRGGYCFEHNTLFAAVLEDLGFSVTRCLGRVRLGTGEGPRPATHMCLVVDGQLVDVGFGAPTPIGPVPLGGEAHYGEHTWRTERVLSPEGEDAWLVRLSDMALYTFTEADRHPVDFLTPNYFTSTHPFSIFTQTLIVQHWREDLVQVGLAGLKMLVRDPYTESTVEVDVLGDTLAEVFGLTLSDAELTELTAKLSSGLAPR